MKKTLIILLILISSTQLQAQRYYEKSVDISVGYALSVPYDDSGFYGTGYFVQGEYMLLMNEWIDLRPYAGYIQTNNAQNVSGLFEAGDKADASALLFGGKARFRIPMDWVAPYAEVGLGGSIGTFETGTDKEDIEKSGVYAHIPFSLGVELGPQHRFTIKLTSNFHASVNQFTGVMAIGYRIPIGYY